MEKCLTFSPKRRIEVDEALKHPYLEVHRFSLLLRHLILTHLQAYHDPQDEPTAEPLDPSFFDFDYGEALGKEELKGTSALTDKAHSLKPIAVLIYEEVTKPRPAR